MSKKGIWTDVVGIRNEEFGVGMKQIWVGIRGIQGKQGGETAKGIATWWAQNGFMTSSSEGKRDALVRHHRKLGTSTTSEGCDAEFDQGNDARVGRGKCRGTQTGR